MCTSELAEVNLAAFTVALRASAAPANEGNRDAVANAPCVYVFTHGLDNTGKLMPRHMRKLNISVMPYPAMPVTAANACRHYLHNHAMRLGGGIRQLLDLWWGGKLLKNHGSHGGIPERVSGKLNAPTITGPARNYVSF